MKTLVTLFLLASYGCCCFAAKAYQDEALGLHTKYRLQHHVQPLKFNNTLNDVAESCAKQYNEGTEIHSCDQLSLDDGENVYTAVHSKRAPDFQTSTITAVSSWYAEKSNYNFTTGNAKNSSKPVDHFTAVVWNDSRSFGFGCHSLDKTTRCVAVYIPGGNMGGYYTKNVFIE